MVPMTNASFNLNVFHLGKLNCNQFSRYTLSIYQFNGSHSKLYKLENVSYVLWIRFVAHMICLVFATVTSNEIFP